MAMLNNQRVIQIGPSRLSAKPLASSRCHMQSKGRWRRRRTAHASQLATQKGRQKQLVRLRKEHSIQYLKHLGRLKWEPTEKVEFKQIEYTKSNRNRSTMTFAEGNQEALASWEVLLLIQLWTTCLWRPFRGHLGSSARAQSLFSPTSCLQKVPKNYCSFWNDKVVICCIWQGFVRTQNRKQNQEGCHC